MSVCNGLMRMPVVRYCRIANPKKTGASSEGEKLYEFLMKETYAMDMWNSTLEYQDRADTCWNKIRDNQSDIFPFVTAYPSNYEFVRYITLVKDSKFLIMSSYVPVNESSIRMESTECISSFKSFSTPVLIITFLLLLMFSALFKFYCCNIRRFKLSYSEIKGSSRWAKVQVWTTGKTRTRTPSKIMLGMLLKQFSCCAGTDNKRSSFKLILLFYMAFLSSLHFMFSAYASTELVILDEPFIFEDYQMLLDHPFTVPVWVANVNSHKYFMDADKGSQWRDLWDKSHRIRCPKDPIDCQEALNSANAVGLVGKMSRQEVVLIASDYIALLVHAALCPLSSTMNMNPVVLRKDKNTRTTSMAISYGLHMDQSLPEVVRVLRVRGMRTGESGIVMKLSVPTESPISSMVSPESVRKCLRYDDIVRDHPTQVQSKPFADFQILFRILALLILLVMIIHSLTLVRGCEGKMMKLKDLALNKLRLCEYPFKNRTKANRVKDDNVRGDC